MLQGPHVLGHDKPLIRLSFTSCVVGTVSLPLLGLITCISISSVFHFQDSTDTHCKVTNYLPSISASISLSPECHIWRFCIGLHSAPRFLVAVAYFNFYKGRFSTRFLEWLLSCLNFICAITENFGLLLLTYGTNLDIIQSPLIRAKYNFICAITENCGLLLLTYVSSNVTYQE